ncbi:hypothetical protein acsn021_24020 [Anaerocolumna cellulosilytica]|uniref:Uncharacterized protein n=2 Tax=Anaerocolumna cellulosilytica TaxID=433286 RepID=A0A6S6QU52_9FIRM|nr:hypothetical protein [Anaerocolumna cellulosilytica]MBB5193953.1 glutamate 5-kinase [Anaerocolumna cellulosilytica]BCJ94833.1 hypothetical protein acsn021_24020 [Anaerocolumna cellulosilytica]
MVLDNYIIVVLVNITSLIDENGCKYNRFEQLIKVLSNIQDAGNKIIIVSSGAIASGANQLNMEFKSDELINQGFFGAIGQCKIIQLYFESFGKYDKTIAQILLNIKDFENEKKKAELLKTLDFLLHMQIIPIIQNDCIGHMNWNSVDKCFEDCIILSLAVTFLIKADKMIIYSDVDSISDNYFENVYESFILQ